MRAWCETLQRRVGLQWSSRSPASFTTFSMWNSPSCHGLSIYCLSFQAQPKHTVPWNHPVFISLPAGFLRLCLYLSSLKKDLPYSVPLRTVHQPLCWTLTLIISNPHSYNPATQEVQAPFHRWGNWDWVRSHHWSEGSQLLNRRAGIWTSSCQFRVFCCFPSGCPSGDWRAYLKWRQH